MRMRLLCFLLVTPLLAIALLPVASTEAQAPADCVIDAVFLIDRANSFAPEDFEQIKAFAAAAVGSMPMGSVRIGVVGFSGASQTQIGLSGDGGAVSGAIRDLSVADDAADFRVALEAGEAALADARPYVSRALVLITDGFSATDAGRRAQLLRTNGIALVTMGIGSGVSSDELYNLASPGYAVFAEQYATLMNSVGRLTGTLCRTSAVIGGTVRARTRDDRGFPITLPASGVPVDLLTEAGEVIRSTTTDTSGTYRFFVAAGRYAVRVHPSGGAVFAPGNDGFVPLIIARLGSVNTRAATLLEINY